MKTIKNYALLFLAIFFMSCSGGGNKFIGKWTTVEKGFLSGTITIEKDNENYKVLSDDGANVGAFIYDKKKDILTMETGREIIDIEYNKETKNITMGSRGRGLSLELQKVK